MAIKKAKAFPTPAILPYMKLLNAVKSDDQTRYFVCECYYDADEGDYGAVVATDGRRLAVWRLSEGAIEALTGTTEKLPSGYVILDEKRQELRPSKLDAQFPMWRKVVPQSSELESAPFPMLRDALSASVKWAAINGICFNPLHIVDIPCNDATIVNVHKGDVKAKKAFTISTSAYCGDLLVVVMPLTLD